MSLRHIINGSDILIEYENLNKTNNIFFKDYKNAFSKFLNSGHYILGEQVLNFEKEFAKYNGSKYCIGVASGTDALTISLKCLNLNKNGEVLVQSNAYIATVLAIINAGLKPVLVEPDIQTYNMSIENLKSKINNNTVAILPTHLYGKPTDMKSILKIANEFNLKIVEDCAQAHGASQNEKKVGNFGDLGAFSFYPTKNLGALGDAGAIVTNNKELAEKARKMRVYGFRKQYYSDILGYNSRLDEFQAAILRIKLKKLDKLNKHKRKLAKIYSTNLSDKIIRPVTKKDLYDVYHIYPIRSDKRDLLRKHLIKKDIITSIHYPVPVNKQVSLQNYFKNERMLIAEDIANTIMSLPISFFHTKEDILNVCNNINIYG